MASSSLKKTASSNTTKLNQLHQITLVIVVLTGLIIGVFKRPQNYYPFILFQLPLVGCEWFLENIGRPVYKFDPVNQYNKLVKSGQDLNQSGLTEYLFDIIYFTWILDLLLIIVGRNFIWYLWLVIPGFIIFKLWGFISPFLPSFKRNNPAEQSSTNSSSAGSGSEKSKRQQKLEKNPNKQKNIRVR